MNVLVVIVCVFALAAYGQSNSSQDAVEKDSAAAAAASPDDSPGVVAQTPAPGETPQNPVPPESQSRSALGVGRRTEAIKEKDLYERSGFLHPFRRMPKFALIDEKRIWTSPFTPDGAT